MEKKLRELFGREGGEMQEIGREGGEISYAEFIRAVEKVQVQTFWNTTQGNIVKAHSKKDLQTMQSTLGSTF
jgi:hypothetical protein